MSFADVTPEEWDRVCKPMMSEGKSDMSVNVSLTSDQADSVIVQELTMDIEWLKSVLLQRKDGKGVSIFDSRPEYDCVLIQEQIDAFQLTLEWYGAAVPERYGA